MSIQPGKAVSFAPDRRHRRFPRFRSHFPVTITLFAGDKYHRMSAQCKDLSEAGIGLLVSTELKMGEVASLNFSPPGSSQIWDVSAVLRHRRGYHYGFEFISLQPEQSATLKNSLKGLERADYDRKDKN